MSEVSLSTVEENQKFLEEVRSFNADLLTVLEFPNPVLSRIADPIIEIDDDLRELARRMVLTMRTEGGIGLAAPQVGVSKQLIVIDLQEEGDGLKILVNPVLSEKKGKVYTNEGCLSFPDKYFRVRRWKSCRVQGFDLDGNALDFYADGMLSIVIQHEVDHLRGICLFDKLPS